jgi:phosphate transport system substrate-binding protein
MKFFAALIVFATVISAQQNIPCGPDGGQISIVGSATVEPIAKTWAEGYMALCPNVNVSVAGGGSSVGSRRVCNSTQPPADVGMMSRQWNAISESNVTDAANGKYICNFGTKTRTITRVDVAIDGITVVLINGGLVAQCLRKLTGQGLSIDQLRWIFSNYTDAQKSANGWDATSIAATDNNDATHKWSEISSLCPNAELKLATPGSTSGTAQFFDEILFPLAAEGIATKRPTPAFVSEADIPEDIVEFIATSSLEVYGDAIGYFGFSYYINEGALFYGVPIRNTGATVWVKPTRATVKDSTYVPFTRRIYMNFFDGTLSDTKFYLQYGLNQAGIGRLNTIGFVPPPDSELPALAARVGAQIFPPAPTAAPVSPPVIGGVPTAPVVPGTPVAAPTKDTTCGLLGLSIFCPFTFCGIFGRLIGLC